MTKDELYRKSWVDNNDNVVVLLKDACDFADDATQEKWSTINNVVENYPHNAVLEASLAGLKIRQDEIDELVGHLFTFYNFYYADFRERGEMPDMPDAKEIKRLLEKYQWNKRRNFEK